MLAGVREEGGVTARGCIIWVNEPADVAFTRKLPLFLLQQSSPQLHSVRVLPALRAWRLR